MEYTVGSIADLISGKNTPNKPKVRKLTLKQQSFTGHSKNINEGNTGKKKKKQKIIPSGSDSNMVVIKHEMLLNSPKRIDSKVRNAVTELLTADDQTKMPKKLKRKKSKELVRLEKSKDTKEIDESGSDSSSDNHSPNIKKKKMRGVRIIIAKDKRKQKTTEDKITIDERNSRTIFVGNVPVTIKERQLFRFFTRYGKVEAVRLRCVAPALPGIPKRLAFIKNMLHPKRLTMHSYVRFELRDDALKALAANGMKYKDHHIRVQISNDTELPDPHKAIFVGNLPFDIEDEDLWKTFESCGTILSVRVVRDTKTHMGIGIAYVNFESSDCVELALQMENVEIRNQVLRIQRYSKKKKPGQQHQKPGLNSRRMQHKKDFKQRKNYSNPFGKNQFGYKHRKSYSNNSNPSNENQPDQKRLKNYSNNSNPSDNNQSDYKRRMNDSNNSNPSNENQSDQKRRKNHSNNADPTGKNQSKTTIVVKRNVFQGSKSNLKKKKPKMNKSVLNKLMMSKKIAPR